MSLVANLANHRAEHRRKLTGIYRTLLARHRSPARGDEAKFAEAIEGLTLTDPDVQSHIRALDAYADAVSRLPKPAHVEQLANAANVAQEAYEAFLIEVAAKEEKLAETMSRTGRELAHALAGEQDARATLASLIQSHPVLFDPTPAAPILPAPPAPIAVKRTPSRIGQTVYGIVGTVAIAFRQLRASLKLDAK